MRQRLAAQALLWGMSASSMACSTPFDHAEVMQLTEPPLPASVSIDAIQLTEGTAVALDLQAYDVDGDTMDLHVSTTDEDGIAWLARHDDFYIVGVNAGGTFQLVLTPGPTIPVRVVSQP